MIYSFEPVFDDNSKILILGTMASVKSLEQGFYYMHPRNRFWKIVAEICGERSVPVTVELKKQMLLSNGIALADILVSCERVGSLDADIKNYTVRDLDEIIGNSKIKHIFCNGKKSFEVSRKSYPKMDFQYLPSTSPANQVNFRKEEWMNIQKYLI